MSRKRYIIKVSIHLLVTLIFFINQIYAGEYLSPKSNQPSGKTLRHLRVLVRGARPEVSEVAYTWNPIKIGQQTEINPDNVRLTQSKVTLPEKTLPRLNHGLQLIKERSRNKRYCGFFNLDTHPGKGILGKWFSEKYLLQNILFFEGPFLADMIPGNEAQPQTSMLNLILFTDSVRSIETLIFVLRHEMDHANPLTERQIKDRDILYFSSLPKKAQDEIIEDIGRIEKEVRVVQESILAGAYKERTGESYIETLRRFQEVLYLAQREGLSPRSKDALREFVGMRRCKVESFDGVPISYTIGGNLQSPVTLLFLHSWTSQSKDWRRQIAEFENEYRIVTVDIRGFGRSGQGNYSKERLPHINDFVEDVKAVIKKERLANIVVLGHSMGGMIGFNLCLDKGLQDLIVGFIPMATTVTKPAKSFINAFFSNLVLRLEPTFGAVLPLLTKPRAVALLDRLQKGWLRNNPILEAVARVPGQYVGLTTEDPEDFHHLWTNSVGETNLRDWLIGYLAMCTHNVEDRLGDIKIPVLWFIGGKDRAVLPEVQRRYAKKIPDSKVLTFDESGHFSHWEEPIKANEAIREFLEDKIRPTVLRKVLTKTADEELAGLGDNDNFKIITTWQEVDRYIEELIRLGEKPSRILVDLDMTVFTPCGYLGSDIWLNQRIEEIGLYHALWEWGDHERRVARCGFYRLVDPLIPEIIERWKANGIEIVGFTAREWHKDSYRTQKILRRLGVSFSRVTSVPGIYSHGGVIYTYGGGVRKAKALKRLTKGAAAGPTVVIDDTPGNIASVLKDRELKKCHGLLYCSPTIERFLKKEALEYIQLGDDAMTKGQFDFAIEYYFNAVEQARLMDPVQKSSAIRQIWQRVEKLNLDGQDTEELVRFLIQYDETKYDLRIMDKRLKDPYLNLLVEKPPITDPEISRVLLCWISEPSPCAQELGESTDLNNLKYTLRVLRGIHKKDGSPKFRIVLRSSSPPDKMKRKTRQLGLHEGIDYDLWFVPEEGQTLINALKKKFRDLVSITEGDVITIGTTGEPLFNNQSIYEGIAKAEEYSIPAEPYSEVSPFSRIDLAALREKAQKKQEFLAGYKPLTFTLSPVGRGEGEGEPIVLFYHNDSDGIAASGAETVFLKEYFGDEIKIIYVPIDYYEPLRKENIPQDSLWIVLDFNYVRFSQKLVSAGISKKEILFQDHHDEDEPKIPDGIIYISPKGLRSDLGSGRYPAGLLTIIVNGETLRQSKDLTSAALYLEKTNWIGALAIYGDYCGPTWSGYLSIYGLDTMHLDKLAERITAVACVDPVSAGLPLMDIINLPRTFEKVRGSPRPTGRLGEEFESRAERVYQQLSKVINKIKKEPIIFYILTPEDLEEGDISIMLVDYLLANFKCELVLIGVERRIGDKRVLILHARSTGIDAGRLMQKISASGGGHAEAGGALIELKEGESGMDVFSKIKENIEDKIKPTGSKDEATSGTRVKSGEFSIVADIGPNWSMYGDKWPDDDSKNEFREVLKDIVDSKEFTEQDLGLIGRITLVSGKDKLAACNRADGQVILDIRSFKNKDVLRLELIHELWHLKLADLRKRGKLEEVNPLIEEVFVILNQINGFLMLSPSAQEEYLDTLAQDTDESEKGLYQILINVRAKGITDIKSCYPQVRGLVLSPKAFRFSDVDVRAFKKLAQRQIEGMIDSLFQLKDVLQSKGEAGTVIRRYKGTRREITSVIRLEGKGRTLGGKERLARILLGSDGFIKESHWDKHKRRFIPGDLEFLQQVFQEVAVELKERFMQINVKELEVFKDLEVIVVSDSDHLIYYKAEGGRKRLFIDKRAFDSKELLLIELERIIGETLMHTMAGTLPPHRLEVVYTLYLSVERFLRFPQNKQEEILRVLEERFPENKKFYKLLLGVRGKDLIEKSQWLETVDKIIDFILEEGIYPKKVQETLKAVSRGEIKKILKKWIQLIECQIQIELAFRSHDPQMRNLAIDYLVKNVQKLGFKEILLNKPGQTVSLGPTRFKLGRIAKFDSSIRCLYSGLYPDRLILVNDRGKFLLVERLTSESGGHYLRISSRSYKLESDNALVDLTGIIQEPKLWIGNYSLVDFWGNRFEELLNRLRSPPTASGLTFDAIPPDIAGLTRRIVSPQMRKSALEYLEKNPLPSLPKAREKVSFDKSLLHIHHYFTLMSTGSVDDFIFAQKKIEDLPKDERLKELVPWLLQHLGISKQFQVLSGLNEQQFKAVTAPFGPTIVIAGAGTGKTRVIVRRLAYILSTQEDVKPENILAITFTKKAAGEIAQRVEQMVGTMRERIQISTFHSFGHRILQDHGYLMGLPHNLRVLDEVEQWQFFRSILPELRKPGQAVLEHYWRRQDPSAVISDFIDFINRAKDNLIGPEEFMEYAKVKGDSELIEVAEVYGIYQKQLLARGYLDYGDLIFYPVRLLETQPDIQARYQEQYKHILVDEFQDTNYAQIRFLQLLGNNVFVVGDDDQAIYQFRGASDASFRLFEKMYPQAIRLKLTQNYRSQPNIIECANRLISNNKFRFDSQKNLWTTKQKGEPVEVWLSPDYKDEAASIADEIQRIYEKTGDYSEIAVLYRAHRHNRELITALEARGIPYVVKGGIPLLNRKEIRDIIAYMRFINEPSDVVSFFRILQTPRFKMPNTQWVELADFMEKNGCTPWDVLSQLNKIRALTDEVKIKLERLRVYLVALMELSLREDVATVFNKLWEGYLEDLTLRGELKGANAYIRKFSDFVEAYLEINPDRPSLAGFMEHLETYILAGGDPEREIQEEKPVNAVQLMTVHRAKGLEFPYVFLINLSQVRFPSRFQKESIPLPPELSKAVHKGDPKLGHYEEERRTMYVGISRAMKKLYLCGVDKKYHPLSQFIKEVLSLSEREGVLVSRDIPAAEGHVAEEKVSGIPALKQEILSLRQKLLMAIGRMGKVDVKARYGGLGWSRNLLDIFHICLAIAQASLVMNQAEYPQARDRLNKFHQWANDILAKETVRFTRHAMGQETTEILGAIPIAQPVGSRLPRPQRFSFTQIAAYLDNPQRYKERYILGIPGFEPEDKALRFGKLMHELLELFNRSLEKGSPVTLDELKQLFTSRLRQALPEFKKSPRFKEFLRRGYTILESFYNREENLIKPIGIEKEFELEIGEDVIGGYIDCIRELPDGRLQIIDYKTGSSKEGFHEKYRLQLLIYALWAHRHHRKEPQDMELMNYYVEEDKYVRFTPTIDDLALAEGKARETIDKIKEELYGERAAVGEEISQEEFLVQYRKRCIEELREEIPGMPKDDFLGNALIYIRLGRLSDQVNEPKDAQRYYRLGLEWLDKFARQVPVDIPEWIKASRQKTIGLGDTYINLSDVYKLTGGRFRVMRLGRNKWALYWRKKVFPVEKFTSKGYPHKQYLRIGDKVYELVPGTKEINLMDILAQPKFWNSGMPFFFGIRFMLENRSLGTELERLPPIRLVKELPPEIKDQLPTPVITESLRTQAILPFWETTLEKIIQDLDPPQLEAVTTTEGPLLVLGGPGTGKTLTLLRRAAYILHLHKDILPENVLILTNSKESVDEFRNGLGALMGEAKARDVSVTTPRNISWRILRENASRVGLPQRFSVVNRAQQRVILRRLWPGLDIKYHFQLSQYPDIIDGLIDYFIRLQQELVFADQYMDYASSSGSEREQELARIYKAWEDAMRQSGMAGNEQLVPLAVKALKDNPEILDSYRARYRYLLVNRLQDLSFAEFTLACLLTPAQKSVQAEGSKNIFAVGDENMGVGHSRIDPRRNFRLFLEKFPDAKTVLLKQNYRSPRMVLSVAKKMLDSVYAELNESSPLTGFRTTRRIGDKVKMIVANSDQEEARAVVDQIKRLYDKLAQDKKDYSRFAVLTKTISAQRYIIEALERENIPYVWDIEKSLFEREEIKDLLALISIFSGQPSRLSLTRFLKASVPGASALEIKRIIDFMKAHEVTFKDVLDTPEKIILGPETKKSLEELRGLFTKLQPYLDDIGLFIGEWFKQTGILKKLTGTGTLEADTKAMNLGKFIRFARKYAGTYPEQKSVRGFWDYLQMYWKEGGDIPSVGLVGEPQGVYVSTITRAGDRGFDNVFITGITAGRFPVIPPRKDLFEIPEVLLQEQLLPYEYSFLEEARLLYTGMTKARERLYLTGLAGDGLSKFLRVILEEAPKEIEYQEIAPGDKGPSLSRYQRLYMTYQNQLIQNIDALSQAGNKGEWSRAWQEVVDTIWNLARLQATQEAVLSIEEAPARIESMDKILARIIKTQLPGVLGKELTPWQRKNWLDWLRFPKRFIEEFPIPEEFRLSHTRIETYEGCPYAYKLKYVFKIPDKSTAATTFGKAMHEVMEHIYTRMNQGEKPALEEILEYYRTHWGSEGYEDKIQERDYMKFGEKILKGYYAKNIEGLTGLPKTELEMEFLVEIGGIPVLGYIDWIETAEGIIRDFKTGKPKTQKDAETSRQLTIYAYAYNKMFERLPKLLEFYNLTTNDRVSAKRTEKELSELEREVAEIATRIQAQEFEPREGFHCKWCRFQGICRAFEAGERMPVINNPGPGSNPGNTGNNPTRGNPGHNPFSNNPALSVIAKNATGVFLDTIKAENIRIRLRKTILVWDTNIKNSQNAMGLLSELERGNLGDNLYFIKGKAESLKGRIDKLKKKIGNDVDIVVVSKVENVERLYHDLGRQDVYITSVDDKNIQRGDYLPILELLSLAMKIVFEDDLQEIGRLYEEIATKPLTPEELKRLRKGILSITLPPANPIDTKIYQLERDILKSV